MGEQQFKKILDVDLETEIDDSKDYNVFGDPTLDFTEVSQIMQKDCSCLNEDELLTSAIEKLIQQGVTGLPVLDATKRVVGFLSQKECLPELMKLRSPNPRLTPLKVADVMSKSIHVLDEDTLLSEAYRMFLDEWYHVYPIVNSEGQFLGVLSRQGILAHLAVEPDELKAG